MTQSESTALKAPVDWGLPILAALALLVSLSLLVLALPGQEWRILGPIAGALVVLLVSISPRRAMVLCALIAFLGTSMPMVNRAEMLNPARWVVLLALGLGMVLRSAVQPSAARWHPVHLSLGSFLLYAVLSSAFSLNPLMTLLKASAFGCLALAAILNGRLELPPQQMSVSSKLLKDIYGCAVVVAMGCVLNLMGLWRPEAGNFSGMFGNANSLGSFMALVAPILMLKTYQALDQGRAVRIVHALFSMSFGVFLVLSRCRGGMVATVVACGWWLVFSYRRLFGLLVGGVAASALVLALYFPHYLESLDEVYVKKGSTYVTQSRENLMLDSWEAAKESPIIGVGFGVARGFSEAWEFEFETGSASREKVNSYLALIEEVGIVGSMFIVAPLLWVLVESARRLLLLAKSCPSSDEFLTTLTLSACFVGGLVNAFFEAWLTAAGFFSTVIFWLIFGALTARLTAPLGKTR